MSKLNAVEEKVKARVIEFHEEKIAEQNFSISFYRAKAEAETDEKLKAGLNTKASQLEKDRDFNADYVKFLEENYSI